MDPCIAYSKTSTLHRTKLTPVDPGIACTCKAYVVVQQETQLGRFCISNCRQ